MPRKNRLYIPFAPYFITFNVKTKFSFFHEDVFCNILIDVLSKTTSLKEYNLIGYKINPDHCHLIIQPTGIFNISKIMHSIKRNSSQGINMLVTHEIEDELYQSYHWTSSMLQYRRNFKRKYNYEFHDFPKFEWQSSFDDVLLKTRNDLQIRIEYLQKQWLKHDLPENKFLYICPELPKNLKFYRNSL